MKKCLKCKELHEKEGNFCSRKCANSRIQTSETKAKISRSLVGRKSTSTEKTNKERLEKCRITWQKKYDEMPFEQLGMENRKRRIKEEQNHKCNHCGLSKWRGEKIALELEHKDGNNENNNRDNLECLCPNCHSLTSTWRGRNKPYRNGVNKVSDEFLLKCLKETNSIRQGLLMAGLAAKGNNYVRAKQLLQMNV